MVIIMNISSLVVGMLETNAYILTIGSDAILIDPGDEAEKIMSALDGKNLLGIIITHHHFDHVGALDEIKSYKKVPVYDISNMKEGKNSIGPFNFQVIYTPGHKEDAISIYFENDHVLFSGDFIFNGSIGRWDFPGGSIADMKKSIQKMLLYPGDIKIYPGHGASTSLNAEKDNLEKYVKYF